MKTSDSIAKIAPALLEAQRHIGVAVKDAKNPHFKSTYADLTSVVSAIKGPLNAADISFLQSVGNDAAGVTVTTRLLHASGEWIDATIYLPVPQQTAQAYGSAITYGKRYGLQSLLGVPSDDDDGQAASVKADPVIDRIKAAGMSGADVNKEAFDGLSDEAQRYIADYATAVTDLHNGKGDVLGYLEANKLDAEEKMALWSLLPSNIRSAIKKAREETKPPVKAAA
jgi:hypothetical protein